MGKLKKIKVMNILGEILEVRIEKPWICIHFLEPLFLGFVVQFGDEKVDRYKRGEIEEKSGSESEIDEREKTEAAVCAAAKWCK